MGLYQAETRPLRTNTRNLDTEGIKWKLELLRVVEGRRIEYKRQQRKERKSNDK